MVGAHPSFDREDQVRLQGSSDRGRIIALLVILVVIAAAVALYFLVISPR